MDCQSFSKSIKCRIEHMRIGQIMIKPKAIDKRTEPQKLGIRTKHVRIGQVVEAFEDDVRLYEARKRRVAIKESDDGAALRAQQVREGRQALGKGKYQLLNRIGPSNRDLNSEGDMLMDGTGERKHSHAKRKSYKHLANTRDSTCRHSRGLQSKWQRRYLKARTVQQDLSLDLLIEHYKHHLVLYNLQYQMSADAYLSSLTIHIF